MKQVLIEALNEAGVSLWRINRTCEESAELFFVKRRLDLCRKKETETFTVTVYRDFEKDGKAMRGSSRISFAPGTSKEEALQGISDAYYAASFVANPTFEMPDKQTCDFADPLASLSCEESALAMAKCLYSAEGDFASFINSSEIFVSKITKSVYTSYGTDVTFAELDVNGEFVVQCKEPEDVEMHHSFAYDKVDGEALRAKAADALLFVQDRAKATPTLKGGTYSVILSDGHVRELLSYFFSRADASAIYPGYSTYKIGSTIHEDNAEGEKLNLTLHATAPYSDTGVPMTDKVLFEDGKLACIFGADRFCSYLGVPMTGDYDSFACQNGTKSLAELKKEPYLHVVSFSDFQCDPFSGHFGGEIRLAYFFDGKEVKAITGGSINGSISDSKDSLQFSLERYHSLGFNGPKAVRLSSVKVAGAGEE